MVQPLRVIPAKRKHREIEGEEVNQDDEVSEISKRPKISSQAPEANFDMSKPALQFNVIKQFGRCRAATITLRHGTVRTPVYMPVGTKGAMKGLLSDTLNNVIDADIQLANTYHLFLTPGEQMLNQFGGLHNYAKWPRNFLTDSGGFQIVSLDALNKIDENAVTFRSHIDGTEFVLTPERSMEI